MKESTVMALYMSWHCTCCTLCFNAIFFSRVK